LKKAAPTVQLALADGAYAERLRETLSQDWAFRDWQVKRVETPNLRKQGVIVLDSQTLERMSKPLAHPERVVLVTRRDPEHLARAWKFGIASVICPEDPPATATLAILTARGRSPKFP
jgi:hypothetical protein